jgi:hypothetical protein
LKPHSSSMMWTLLPFGVGHEYTSIMCFFTISCRA